MTNLNGKTTEEIEKMGWEKVGVAAVDSGTIIIGDPAYYTVDASGDNGLEFEDWSGIDNKHTMQMKFERGHAGRGVVISRFGGDGIYDVFVQKSDKGDTIAAMIKFRWCDDYPKEEKSGKDIY